MRLPLDRLGRQAQHLRRGAPGHFPVTDERAQLRAERARLQALLDEHQADAVLRQLHRALSAAHELPVDRAAAAHLLDLQQREVRTQAAAPPRSRTRHVQVAVDRQPLLPGPRDERRAGVDDRQGRREVELEPVPVGPPQAGVDEAVQSDVGAAVQVLRHALAELHRRAARPLDLELAEAEAGVGVEARARLPAQAASLPVRPVQLVPRAVEVDRVVAGLAGPVDGQHVVRVPQPAQQLGQQPLRHDVLVVAAVQQRGALLELGQPDRAQRTERVDEVHRAIALLRRNRAEVTGRIRTTSRIDWRT